MSFGQNRSLSVYKGNKKFLKCDIDYLQLVSVLPEERRYGNREREVAEISRAAKRVTKIVTKQDFQGLQWKASENDVKFYIIRNINLLNCNHHGYSRIIFFAFLILWLLGYPTMVGLYNRKNCTNLTIGRKKLCKKFGGLKIVRIFVLTILLNKFVSNEKQSERTGKAGQRAAEKAGRKAVGKTR